ncbi:hypothetical protein [Algibacter lectus]|uniref:hypothetical protein n=1 Tax=Algibacter lectus TaxID=221126 RepID=UPI0026ED8254|nr:hypothetical protein [Algibacter lectus]MDO7138819.1 hypothetical protein [Algibacter lectus]
MGNKKKKKSKNIQILNSLLKWIGGFILGVATLYGIYLQSPYYETYKKGKEAELLPIIEIQQNNPDLDPFRPKNIEFAYPIVNNGKSRANNIEIQIFVPGETSVHFVPNIFELSYIKEKKEFGDSIEPKKLKFKTMVYKSKLLDAGDYSIMYISMNKSKFERLNSLPKLDYNTGIIDADLVFPHFTFIKYDEGQGIIKRKDSLILTKQYIKK